MKRILGFGALLFALSVHAQTYTYEGTPIGTLSALHGFIPLDAPLAVNGTHIILTESFSSHGGSYSGTVCKDGTCSSITASTHAVGTLAIAPEIDPASAASALTPLFGGIDVMRGRKGHA